MKTLRFTTFAATAAAATLLITGCGYDPGTVEDGGERRQQIEEAQEAGAEESDRQMTAHLLADAQALIEITDGLMSDPSVPTDILGIADRVKVLAAGQIGSLPEEFQDGGAAAIRPAEVLDAEDPAAAYIDLLSTDLPRLSSAWSALEDAQNETLATTARMSVEEIDAIEQMLP